MPIKQGEFSITQNDANITKANGTVAIMSDIFLYTIPLGTNILIRPEDVICAYMKDAGAEAVATDQWQLVAKDPNSLTTEILASGIYTEIKTFDDRNKTKKIGQSRLLDAQFILSLQFKATTVLVYTSCYFKVSVWRYYKTL